MPRRTLLWRIYPYYLIVIFISILAVWLYASRTMESLYLKGTSSDLESRARLLDARFAEGGFSGQPLQTARARIRYPHYGYRSLGRCFGRF